jgi:hypothetical protein
MDEDASIKVDRGLPECIEVEFANARSISV